MIEGPSSFRRFCNRRAAASSRASMAQRLHPPEVMEKPSEPKDESVWFDGVELAEFPRPRTNVRADVCVVGAGIAGLTTAYLLATEGRSVVVVDDGSPGGGMTSAT